MPLAYGINMESKTHEKDDGVEYKTYETSAAIIQVCVFHLAK
jgi:hypothetical protein